MENIKVNELNRLTASDILMLAKVTDKAASMQTVNLFYKKYARYEIGVLNACLIHSLRQKKGHVPNLMYLDKTMKTWIVNNRHTASKALNYLKQYNSWKNSANADETKKMTTSKVDRPEWLDEYLEEIANMGS